MKRKDLIAALKAAGAQGDRNAMLHLYTSNRISLAAANAAYDEGVLFAAQWCAKRDQLDHLKALHIGLSRETARQAISPTPTRAIIIAQRKREIAHEINFLQQRGVTVPGDLLLPAPALPEMSDDDLLMALSA